MALERTVPTLTDAWQLDDLAVAPLRARVAEEASAASDLAAARERELAEAYTLGFDEGRREGEQAEQARLRLTVGAAEEALETLRSNEERWNGAIEENIAALAVTVARHIVDREIASDHEIVLRLVRRAVGEFRIDQPVRIRINPNDLAILEHHSELSLTNTIGAPTPDAQWIGDPRIASGGCVVEGRERIVDGRVDTGLERVYRRLTYNDA